jgi:hypothetical protein
LTMRLEALVLIILMKRSAKEGGGEVAEAHSPDKKPSKNRGPPDSRAIGEEIQLGPDVEGPGSQLNGLAAISEGSSASINMARSYRNNR